MRKKLVRSCTIYKAYLQPGLDFYDILSSHLAEVLLSASHSDNVGGSLWTVGSRHSLRPTQYFFESTLLYHMKSRDIAIPCASSTGCDRSVHGLNFTRGHVAIYLVICGNH